MRHSNVLRTCFGLLLVAFAVANSKAATYTLHYTDAGPEPRALTVRVGDKIEWDASFAWTLTVKLTDPTSAHFLEVDHACWDEVVGTLTVRTPGAYSLETVVDIGSGKQKVFTTGFTVAPDDQSFSSNVSLLDFGELAAGETTTRSITLFNTTSTPISIEGIAHSSSAFKIEGVNLPLTIASGASTEIPVTFATNVEGASFDTIVITPTGAAPIAVALTGFVKKSPTSSVQRDAGSELSISIDIDPGSGERALRVNTTEPLEVDLRLMDVRGMLVRTYHTIAVTSGENRLPLATHGLANGEYYLEASVRGVPVAVKKVLILH